TTIMPDTEFAMRPVGTGPTRGAKGRMGVKFEAFPNGHHSPKIAETRSSQGGDPLVQIRTLLNGGVHGLITVAPPYRPDVAASDDVALKSYDLRSWWFVALNTVKGPTRNAKIRQALDVSIDRQELRQLTMGVDPDERLPACQFISGPFISSSPYYNRSVDYHERSDIKAARALMQEAGAVEQGGRWVFEGQPIIFRIGLHSPLDLEARDLLNQLANQLSQAGFGQEVYKIKAEDWVSSVVTGKQVESYDLLIGKWSFGVVENINPLFHTREGGQGSLNIFNYSNPTVDQLLSDWDKATTDTAAQDAYHELHQLLAKDLPYLFLWKLDTKSAWRMEVRNNTITPYFYFTEFSGWTLE
ncbi:MAG: hypothetical protein HN348_20085, partial [Proteobacteria bacterium]|nr:hypothetical protein [Pseudomonadota bacterium]